MTKIIQRLLMPFALLFLLNSCKKSLPDPEFPANTNLVSATFIGSFTKSDLAAKAAKSGFAIYSPLTNYDVDYYKIIYKTTYKNNEIQASGLLGIPKNMPKAPSLLSVHHTEITRFADAPSNFPASFGGIELFASAGFIEIIPDYIGLGVSSKIAHPYYQNEYVASPVIDMIKATKYFLQRKKVAYNSKLFLTGFGEGGYVTARTQYVMETDSTHEFTVTGAAEGGGILSVSAYFVVSYPRFVSTPPFFLPMLLKGYYGTFDWNRPLTDYLSPAYAMRLPSLLDGTKTTGEINAEISSSPDLVLNPDFQRFDFFRPIYPEFASAITTTSGIPYGSSGPGYAPKAQTRFYGDTFSPVTNTLLVVPLDNFCCTPRFSHIGFRTVDRTIPSTGQPMLLDAMQWFIELDK